MLVLVASGCFDGAPATLRAIEHSVQMVEPYDAARVEAAFREMGFEIAERSDRGIGTGVRDGVSLRAVTTPGFPEFEFRTRFHEKFSARSSEALDAHVEAQVAAQRPRFDDLTRAFTESTGYQVEPGTYKHSTIVYAS